MSGAPFKVTWDEAAFAAHRERIRAYRFAPGGAGEGWRYGCDADFLRELCAYWTDGFDVAACAAELNRYPQQLHEVEGVSLHTVHLVGEAKGERPLLLVHGWPGSIMEFWRMAEPLAFPSRHGGGAEDAFDLIIPSLPGFGFSGKPEGLLGARTTARLFDTLMRERLGYDRYLVQGGDWGAAVGAWLALDFAESLHGLHLNMILVKPEGGPQSEEEQAWVERTQRADQTLGAYARLQSTKPESIAYALRDDPVALAAWIVERFHDWADLRERRFEDVFTRDQLLTDVMIYLMNDAFRTSARYYAAAVAENVRAMPAGRKVEVPTAFASCPDPRSPPPPRSWIERGYNLRQLTEFGHGGHFAAMEAPDLLLGDVRAFARSLAF